MDFSKFSDEDFDVKEWVNSAFRTHKEGTKDQYATTLVLKLQLFIQEVNKVVEESCQEAVQNMPRVQRELAAVQQEAALLQQQMTAVRAEIEQVERETSSSMEQLTQLDAIKTRMQLAADTLRQADNWSTLSASVEDVFATGDPAAMAELVKGLQQSLAVLGEVPDYEARKDFLEGLKDRLEAALGPRLVQAFNSQATDAAASFVAMFSTMERLPQLHSYYLNCRKPQVLDAWTHLCSERGGEPLCTRLSCFYDQLLQMWHDQVTWCEQLFDDPVGLVCRLVCDSLTSLDPALASCLASHLEGHLAQLTALIEVKTCTERFARSLEAAIDAHTASKGSTTTQPEMVTLAAAIYAPFRPYVARYAQFEQAELLRALEGIRLDHSDPLDCVRLLAESTGKLQAAARLANERCMSLTNGCGYVSLLAALKSYMSSYVREFRRVLNNLSEKCGVRVEQGEEVEDWSWFQNSLRIIHTCGELLLSMEELDQMIVADIMKVASSHLLPPSPHRELGRSSEGKRVAAFQDFATLLLDSEEARAEVVKLVTALEEGEMSVLDEALVEARGLTAAAHKLAFDIVFAPLKSQLSQVPAMQVWTSETAGGTLVSDLPQFSLSPLEYITKVGQYLLTLPQQLEPFVVHDSPALAAAIIHGQLPHATQRAGGAEQFSDIWLEAVAHATMLAYHDHALRIPVLTGAARRQLCTDVDYLCNVLEDLGLAAAAPLHQLAELLQAPDAEFATAAATAPHRVAGAVAKMRGLTLD